MNQLSEKIFVKIKESPYTDEGFDEKTVFGISAIYGSREKIIPDLSCNRSAVVDFVKRLNHNSFGFENLVEFAEDFIEELYGVDCKAV